MTVVYIIFYQHRETSGLSKRRLERVRITMLEMYVYICVKIHDGHKVGDKRRGEALFHKIINFSQT